jgi:hypothetical protein
LLRSTPVKQSASEGGHIRGIAGVVGEEESERGIGRERRRHRLYHRFRSEGAARVTSGPLMAVDPSWLMRDGMDIKNLSLDF